MSAPKVFVSSTCYDLKQVRQDIESFILSYGYTPILSERHGCLLYTSSCAALTNEKDLFSSFGRH